MTQMDLWHLSRWLERRHAQLNAVVALAPNPRFIEIDRQVKERLDRHTLKHLDVEAFRKRMKAKAV